MINFPDAPYNGQIYVPVGGNASWQYDGQKWNAATQGVYLLTTGGTVTGNLNITGNLSIAGNTTLNTASATTPPLNDVSSAVPTTSWVNAWVGSRNFATQTWVQSQGYATTASVAGAYLPLVGGNLTGPLRISYGDSQITFVVSGSSKGLRIVNDTNQSRIEGVDQTGVTSFQPLWIGGSYLLFTINGSGVGQFTGGGFFIVYGPNATYSINTSYATYAPNRIIFRGTAGDEPSSGSIDYRGFDPTALSIVGAGTSGTNRYIRLFDNVYVGGYLATSGPVYVTSTAFRLTNDGNCHIECDTQLWINYYTGQAINLGADAHVVSGRWLYVDNGSIVLANNQWYTAKDTGGTGHGIALITTANEILFGGGDLQVHIRSAGRLYYECTDHHNFNNNLVLQYGKAYYGTDTGGGYRRLLLLDSGNNLLINVDGPGYLYVFTDIHAASWLYVAGQIRVGSQIWADSDLIIGPNCMVYGRDGSSQLFEMIGVRANNMYINDGYRFINMRGVTVCDYLNMNNGIDFWSNNHRIVFYWTGDSYVLNSYVDGTYIGAVQISPCDMRWKNDIEDSQHDALAAIRNVKLYSYNQAQAPSRRTSIGFIAQQLEDIVPEAINKAPITKDATETAMSLDLLPLVAYAFRAIQQLSDRFDKMEARLDELQ